jgi:hypothetical protein
MYTKFGDGENDYQPLKDGKKTGWEVKFGGLTKREHFAGLAMQGLLASCSNDPITDEKVLKQLPISAVQFADALLTELEKTKQQEQ